MEVTLTPEVEALIFEIAAEAGAAPEQIVAQAVADFAGASVPVIRPGATAKAAGLSGAFTAEVDSRGKTMPARHLAGGIITPQ